MHRKDEASLFPLTFGGNAACVGPQVLPIETCHTWQEQPARWRATRAWPDSYTTHAEAYSCLYAPVLLERECHKTPQREIRNPAVEELEKISTAAAARYIACTPNPDQQLVPSPRRRVPDPAALAAFVSPDR
ncbi:hypothetical protein G6011_04891 [Alternaria panax]|uniref:Uncharacterized protein n=1 Tax=Alternaria panax TaxID=48097 RepID=A0AAD4NT41_9PLEO|nr:hypothetical protein G6011_04891 [Alternaria panax]